MLITDDLYPMPNDIIVINLEKGIQKTKGGIILSDDNGKEAGIRSRWAQIYRVGKNITDPLLKVGNWILIDHAHWSSTIQLKIDEKIIDANIIIAKNVKEGIMLSSDEKPDDIQVIDSIDLNSVTLF